MLIGQELREDDDAEDVPPAAVQADEGEAAVLARIAERRGDEIASMVASIMARLRAAGVRVRPGRASLRVRLRLSAGGRPLSLFFVTVGGKVKFGWMRTGQLVAAGLASDFADSFYRDVAERFDIPLKDSVPDGLTVKHLAIDSEFFVDRVLEFVEEVRRTAASPEEPSDDEETEDDDDSP